MLEKASMVKNERWGIRLGERAGRETRKMDEGDVAHFYGWLSRALKALGVTGIFSWHDIHHDIEHT